jgi:hypothetical protein
VTTNALQQQHSISAARQHTLLIATTDRDQRAFLAAKLTAHAIDVMILGRLQRPADGPALLRAVRAGEHPRIHPAQPVITLGADIARLRTRLTHAGAGTVLVNKWGQGWSLTAPQ